MDNITKESSAKQRSKRYHATAKGKANRNRLQREYYARNRSRIAEKAKKYDRNKGFRRRRLMKLYGMTEQQYNQLLAEQNGKCAICGDEPDKKARQKHLHVDHCHKTGNLRGLLCGRCNHGLGNFKDSLKILKFAFDYLKRCAILSSRQVV